MDSVCYNFVQMFCVLHSWKTYWAFIDLLCFFVFCFVDFYSRCLHFLYSVNLGFCLLFFWFIKIENKSLISELLFKNILYLVQILFSISIYIFNSHNKGTLRYYLLYQKQQSFLFIPLSDVVFFNRGFQCCKFLPSIILTVSPKF